MLNEEAKRTLEVAAKHLYQLRRIYTNLAECTPTSIVYFSIFSHFFLRYLRKVGKFQSIYFLNLIKIGIKQSIYS